MPDKASGKKTKENSKSDVDNLNELFGDLPPGESMANSSSAKTEPRKYTGFYRTGPGGNVVVNKPLTSSEWNKYASEKGWEKVTGGYPTTYASYKIPGKSYEIIKDGKKVRIPYETYTMPTKDVPAVDPTIKPLDFNNRIGVYDPKTDMYTNPMTGKIIPTEVQSFKEPMKKGGMVKGYAVGGSPAFLEGNPEVNKVTNNGKGYNPAPTKGSKQGSFSLSPKNQNAAAAGLAAGTSALNSYNEKKQGEMTYGSNAYFDKRNKNNQTSDTIMSLAGTAGSAVNPLLGAAITALPAASKAITGADAYGVSDKGDTRVALGAMLNPATAYQSLGKGYKEIAKGNIGRGLAYMTPLGALMTNDQNRYEREKLKFENEQGQNQAEYNQAVQDTQAQGKYNVQNALAMRNEGIANYTSDDFVKDPTLKQAEFNAPGKNKTLTAFGLAKGGAVKGGTIKGSGTGTSDSIDAQVKENSFVVPAKNNRVAKTLREMMLGDDPDTMAKVKQGMGPKVKLSNGEHLFTPAERAKLEAKGVNLYDLAPEAEDSDKYSMGGYMKKRMMGYANGGDVTEDDFVKREQAKIDAERIRNEKVMSRQQAQLIAEKKSADLRYKKYEELQGITKGLENQSAARKKADEEYKKNLAEYEAIKSAYSDFSKSADEAKKQRPTAGQQLIGNQTTFAPDYEKEKQKRLAMVQEAKAKVDKSKRQLEFTSSEKNFVGDLAPKKPGAGLNYLQGDRPMVAANTANTTTTTPAAAKKGASGTTAGTGKKAAAPVYNPMMSDTFDPIAFANANPGEIPEGGLPASTPVAPSPASLAEASVALKPGVKAMEPIDPNNPLVTANEQAVTNSNVANPTGAKFSWQDGLGAAINYGLPLAQSIIGFNQLQKIGDRPVDKLDPDLVNAFDTSRNNAIKADLSARYGMSAEELAAFRSQNAALTNAGRYNARNFSGGSGANALNMERSVINDSFDRALQAKIADKNIQMQKQQNAYALQNSVNSLAQYKQEANRRLFNDDLAAFQQKTDAASGLMATGLSNLSDAAAADKRMREFRKMNSK